jgi:hypothetical protein
VNENPVVVAVPGVGEIEVTFHALERMRERNVTRDDLRERLLSDPQKLLGVKRIATPDGVQVTIGRLTLVVALVETNLRVVSVWWRGTPGGTAPPR